MNTADYFTLSSTEVLNILMNKHNLEISNIKYSQWAIISTSLLLSENLLKNENIYQKITSKQFTMLENILDKTMSDTDYSHLDSYFLNERNQIVNPFHNLTDDNFEYHLFMNDKQYKRYRSFGCNKSIISNNSLDYKKLIIRIRNSIAHSTYEVIDDNYLRLYHYDDNNHLNFNAKINKVIVLTIIDELNQMVSNLYQPFLDEYFARNREIQYTCHELSEEEIKKELLQYTILNSFEIDEILSQAKKYKSFYPNYNEENNYDKFSIIYDLIYGKIKPICDYGIIVNEIIFELFKQDNSIDNYYYEKYGYYDYFHSDFFQEYGRKRNQVLEENIYKLFLFAYLNTNFLYNFNTHNISYNNINFSLMEIDETIKQKYMSEKYKSIKELFCDLESKEKSLLKITLSRKKLETQYQKATVKNDFVTKVLPERISNLKEIYKNEYFQYLELKKQVQQQMYNKLFEVTDLNDNINLNSNLAIYIITHLRNSLAHGYITFPDGFDYNNPIENIICFEDYGKNQKNNLTFRGKIKIKDLLQIINPSKKIDVLENKSK